MELFPHDSSMKETGGGSRGAIPASKPPKRDETLLPILDKHTTTHNTQQPANNMSSTAAAAVDNKKKQLNNRVRGARFPDNVCGACSSSNNN